jgi:hypothetical protein
VAFATPRNKQRPNIPQLLRGGAEGLLLAEFLGSTEPDRHYQNAARVSISFWHFSDVDADAGMSAFKE